MLEENVIARICGKIEVVELTEEKQLVVNIILKKFCCRGRCKMALTYAASPATFRPVATVKAPCALEKRRCAAFILFFILIFKSSDVVRILCLG